MSNFETSYQSNKLHSVINRNNKFFQPKLTINQPNDIYEQEADAMADKIMRMPVKENNFFQPSTNFIQRKCAACEEEEKEVQRKGTSPMPVDATSEVASYIHSLSSTGSPLPDESRNFFESRFGADFSGVRIHNDAGAATSAQSVNALAYTFGNNIVFGQNQFSPATDDGKKLLAHELTHVVQQNGNSVHRNTIQRITVSAAAPLVKNTCGGFEQKFTFRLDKAAPTDGYFVQQIDRYDDDVNCPGFGACPAKPTTTFWEAFFVKANSFTFYRQGIGFTDSSDHNPTPNKSGARYAYGEIRFFPISVTGNLGRNKVAGLWKPGNAGGVRFSHNLPSTDKMPSWWGQQTEGPAKRYVTADWRCCNDSNDYNVIKSGVNNNHP